MLVLTEKKMGKRTVIFRGKESRFFLRTNSANKFIKVAYFSEPKSWMQITTKKNVLQKFNHEISENRKVIVFLDGVTVHPEALVRK